MLSERDRAVVDSYARCGMSLDTLYMSFPSFNKEDIKAVYDAYKNESVEPDEPAFGGGISINCS